jgi:hypothetical protein
MPGGMRGGGGHNASTTCSKQAFGTGLLNRDLSQDNDGPGPSILGW